MCAIVEKVSDSYNFYNVCSMVCTKIEIHTIVIITIIIIIVICIVIIMHNPNH